MSLLAALPSISGGAGGLSASSSASASSGSSDMRKNFTFGAPVVNRSNDKLLLIVGGVALLYLIAKKAKVL